MIVNGNGLPGFRTVETDERVPGDPAFVSRFRWRAERLCRRYNSHVLVPFYRWEVVPWYDGDVCHTMPRPSGCRWAVMAFQNVAEPIGET